MVYTETRSNSHASCHKEDGDVSRGIISGSNGDDISYPWR